MQMTSSVLLLLLHYSAANSGLYAASRMMWSLSEQKLLPGVFATLSKSGTPIVALVVTMFGAIPGLLSEQFAPETIFKNLLGVAAFTMVIVWMSICLPVQFPSTMVPFWTYG